MSELKKRFSVFSVILIGFLMGAMFVAGGVAAYKFYFPQTVSADDGNTSGQVDVGPSNITETVKKVSPAVVNIEATVTQQNNPLMNDPFFNQFFGNRNNHRQGMSESVGIGSGFIFDKSGLILTNQHVIDGTSEIQVKMTGFDKPVKATVVGSDADLDLAVLKVNVNKDLPALKLGDSVKTEVGSWVIAIGNPLGLDHTVTVGVISAKSRPLTISNRLYKNLLQTDAAINPGNSGGPLLNVAGEVIGINTAVDASAQGIGFAIPSATFKDALNDLVTKGKVVKAYIGVSLQSLDQELAAYLGTTSTDGALISYVAPGSPAEKANLQKGDIITEINNKKITTPTYVTDIVQGLKIGDSIILKVFRQGQAKSMSIKLAEKP
ncbi:MAG: peptidase S1 [Firmicutes bacterium HGW-Firmicutes-8]|nr:MAG: peptidase S1 [Firmicutes bacterium HGW-Firmicutes-8]